MVCLLATGSPMSRYAGSDGVMYSGTLAMNVPRLAASSTTATSPRIRGLGIFIDVTSTNSTSHALRACERLVVMAC